MREGLSPEEKLLKLIKGDKKSQIVKMVSTSDIRPSIANIKSSLFLVDNFKLFTSKNIQKLIFLLLGVSFLYLFIAFIYPWFGLKGIKLPKIIEKRLIEPELEQKQNTKPYESYLQDVKNRQIFSSSSSLDSINALQMVSPDLTKDINLVGIISGNNPKAVIEDKKTQKTYYLNKGQFIEEFQVEDIQKGKIILNYRGQRYELHI